MKASELKNMDMRELIDELNNLDFENVGGWPTPIKIGIGGLVLLAVLLLGYFFVIQDLNVALEQQQREEASLLKSYEDKAFEAHNLDQFRSQLVEMEQTFGALLKQLPKDTEVPGLLEDITHTGLGSGMEFEKIELKQEAEKEFYAELPIDISALGDYHGFGSFVSGVAALPRIVTLHDFVIEWPSSKDAKALGLLNMHITAKTYRYSTQDSGSQNTKPTRGRNK